jgi:hypothetical protein
VALPGPPGGEWALALALGAVAAGVLGEPVRQFASRWVSSWRRVEPIERGLLDFYLGGAVLYLVAALPFGLFVAPVVFGLPVAAGALLVVRVYLVRRRRGDSSASVEPLRALARPSYLVVLLSAVALYALELAIALPVGTGNTFDSSLLTTYTALLLRNHSIPLSFAPYATTSILYPQGTTAWLGWAQLTFGLPPARTSLLVTPLFFALAPLGAFVFGHRWFGSARAGAALALSMAWLAPATRGLVGGSNDFVFAFPLVLVLAGEAAAWFRPPLLSVADALGFGVLAGYSAAINPVGAEWLLPAILLGTALVRGPNPLRSFAGFGRWCLAGLASLVGVVPSLYVLVLGRTSPGFVPGAAAAPPGTPLGITSAQFLGSVDPFLFRSQDVQLSPVPELRAELAILLVLGSALLILVTRDSATGRYLARFRDFALTGALVLVGLLGVLWAASTGFAPAVAVTGITSAGELSLWLFTLYVFVAAVPLVLAFEWTAGWFERAAGPAPVSPARRWHTSSRGASPFRTSSALVPIALAVVILAPGVALTPTSLPPVLSTLYTDFGNVTGADFALLDFAAAHLSPGARVLVAPGSAAEFLPGYAPNLVLLYPLVPGWEWANGSYTLLVRELSNATLDAKGFSALGALEIGYVVVTGNNTTIWSAFSPAPLLRYPSAFGPPLFHEGDAYLFAWNGSTPVGLGP